MVDAEFIKVSARTTTRRSRSCLPHASLRSAAGQRLVMNDINRSLGRPMEIVRSKYNWTLPSGFWYSYLYTFFCSPT